MFKVAKDCYKKMIQDAVTRLPNEACGLLSGTDAASTFYSMTNTDRSPATYLMDPKEQFQVFKTIRAQGERLLAICHSHVATEAYPSAKDVSLAFYPEVHYVLVSLTDRERPSARAFRIIEGEVQEEPIQIV